MLSLFRAARRPSVAELREPDDEAKAVRRPTFDEVFASVAPYAWRALHGLGVREADVDDAFQEVFLVVHRRLESFNQGASIRTWVYGI
jgi:DNA-directed RNA polymerase specialized sigma24 family protein